MNISPMTPRYLQETFLNICIVIGALVALVGLFCLIFTELSKIESLIVTAIGVVIVFGFWKVKSLKADLEPEDQDASEDAP